MAVGLSPVEMCTNSVHSGVASETLQTGRPIRLAVLTTSHIVAKPAQGSPCRRPLNPSPDPLD